MEVKRQLAGVCSLPHVVLEDPTQAIWLQVPFPVSHHAGASFLNFFQLSL